LGINLSADEARAEDALKRGDRSDG